MVLRRLGLLSFLFVFLAACSSTDQTDTQAGFDAGTDSGIRSGDVDPRFEDTTTDDDVTVPVEDTTTDTVEETVEDPIDDPIEDPQPTGGEVEPNDSTGQATPTELADGSPISIDGRMTYGDYDYYSFTIDGPTELEAWTSDGAGGCVIDTILAVQDSSGTEISRNDDDYGGLSPCSKVTGVALVEPGQYYLVVSGFYDEEDGIYTLHGSLTTPRCGDMRLSAGEECDDGNREDGDGCDECSYEAIDEIEPNDDTLEATEIEGLDPATPVLIRGEIDGGSDADYYAVEMGAGDSFIRIDVIPASGGCFDAKVELLDTDRTSVLSMRDYSYSASSCALLSGSEVEDLKEGTHYIRVTADDTGGGYLLNLVVRRARCGNGVREGVESCDDANEDADDGCDECTLDADPETEPNDDMPDADVLGTFLDDGEATFYGEVGADDLDYFSLTVGAGARVELWTDDGGSGCNFDSVLEFFDSEGEELAENDSGGVGGGCSKLDKTDEGMNSLSAGKYIVLVRGYYSSTSGYYVLHAAVIYPGCGDGAVEGDEVCDDRNEEDGDGCSATCQPEGTPEVESNDTIGDVTAVTLPSDGEELVYTGEISSASGDADFFGVTVEDGAQISATLENGSGGCSVESRMSLRTSAGVVARAGSATDEGCWQIGGTEDSYGETTLDAGTYYLRAVGYSGGTGHYQLRIWADYP